MVKPENDDINNAMPTDCLHGGKGGQRPETKASESLITVASVHAWSTEEGSSSGLWHWLLGYLVALEDSKLVYV